MRRITIMPEQRGDLPHGATGMPWAAAGGAGFLSQNCGDPYLILIDGQQR
jgi:hypothetical protein